MSSAPTSTPLGGNDVASLTVGITEERDVGASVGVVLDPLNLCGNAIFDATKIDDAIVLLVATTAMPSRDPAKIVAAGCLGLRLCERVYRTTLKEVGMRDLDHGTLAGRGWLEFYDGH
jgi:hypothetical protein